MSNPVYWNKLNSIRGAVLYSFFLHDSDLGGKSAHGDAVPAECKRPSTTTQVAPRRKIKRRPSKEGDKSKVRLRFFSYLFVCRMKCSKIAVRGRFMNSINSHAENSFEKLSCSFMKNVKVFV